MSIQAIDITSLPVTKDVANALNNVFLNENVDLKDVVKIAFQDPVLLANIILLVNQSFQKNNRPVVNTLSAAINLVGMSVLSKKLLSLKKLGELTLSVSQIDRFNIIRNRITVAAHITKFWAGYMGEKNIEEQFCVSMFTGLNHLYECITLEHQTEPLVEHSYLDSIDHIRVIYSFSDDSIARVPDSIQQIYRHSSYTRRLKLSILCYELVLALELGYSSKVFHHKLDRVIDCIDQSMSRAAYDFSIQVVEAERNAEYASFSHTSFFVGTNTDEIATFDYL
jgi:hypothetical protein